jgi:purine-binding chemotaxis protein CheW
MKDAYEGDTLKDAQEDVVSALLFRVQSRLYALPVTHVVETMRPLPIERMVDASPAIKGLSLIRGMPTPVLSLAFLLEEDTDFTRFITVSTVRGPVALTASSVLGVHPIAASSLHDLPPLLKDANSDAISAIGTADAELLTVLNAARLLPDAWWDSLHAARTPS